jgi:hypothetical protein
MKESFIKLRVSDYLKQRAKDCASSYNWTLSRYLRSLILIDINTKLYDRIIPLIEENVGTFSEIPSFTHEGTRFYIVPENQVKKIVIGVDEKK